MASVQVGEAQRNLPGSKLGIDPAAVNLYNGYRSRILCSCFNQLVHAKLEVIIILSCAS